MEILKIFFLPAFIICVFLLTRLILKSALKSNRFKGWLGERKITRILKGCMQPGDVLISDLYLLNPENKMSSQIDHILLSTRGIFVIETKNYSGEIVGDDSKRMWNRRLKNGKLGDPFLSPVQQNNGHIYTLKSVLKTKTQVENLVVFVQGNIKFIKSAHVFTPQGLKQYLCKKTLNILSKEERDRFYSILQHWKEHPPVTRRKHLRNIKRQIKGIRNLRCPRCRGKLVVREGPYGTFYGCSNYPKCSFTKEI